MNLPAPTTWTGYIRPALLRTLAKVDSQANERTLPRTTILQRIPFCLRNVCTELYELDPCGDRACPHICLRSRSDQRRSFSGELRHALPSITLHLLPALGHP